MSKPIETCVAKWHRIMNEKNTTLLGDLLADNAVFISPVVHSPQVGKPITMAYLAAASEVLGNPSFKYVDEVIGDDRAVLEFTVELDGKVVNGVDLIRCNADGQIIEFKVMVRPLQGMNAVHAAMGAALQRFAEAAG